MRSLLMTQYVLSRYPAVFHVVSGCARSGLCAGTPVATLSKHANRLCKQQALPRYSCYQCASPTQNMYMALPGKASSTVLLCNNTVLIVKHFYRQCFSTQAAQQADLFSQPELYDKAFSFRDFEEEVSRSSFTSPGSCQHPLSCLDCVV